MFFLGFAEQCEQEFLGAYRGEGGGHGALSKVKYVVHICVGNMHAYFDEALGKAMC